MNATIAVALDFQVFKRAIASQFELMQKHPMFRTAATGDELWAKYLSSFPPGTNPIFREKTEYDCSCCRQFIRTIGNAVAVIRGQLVSIWDAEIDEPAYAAVAKALSTSVKSQPIESTFLHYERHAGTDKSREQLNDGSVRTWNHFHVTIAQGHTDSKANIPSVLGAQRSSFDVLKRGFEEITVDAIETVLEMIAQGSLYRGEEHKGLVTKFQTMKSFHDQLVGELDRSIYVWVTSRDTAIARIRNTVIGTLLVDLSEGVDLERAVAAFEAKVAPTNYKRPKTLVTKKMVEEAKQAVEELGLTSALSRRHAVITDLTINNILFADRSARQVITGGVFDDLSASVAGRVPKNFDGIEEVPIERFVSEVLPKIDSMEVLLENRLAGNLVSLIAPTDPSAGLLFKWPNRFSWSYVGELTDSIREKVKKAGGNVVGDLCCRLAWHNYDDLDFHMYEPHGHIYYGNRHTRSPSGGLLDVDMNAGSGQTREPVENIFYASRRTMREGVFHLLVNQFSNRDTTDPGFEVEIDWLGDVKSFAYGKAQRSGENVTVAKFEYTHKDGIKILESLPMSTASKTLWGLPTQSFHRVTTMMLSPNYWDGAAIGNKHFMFMLDGCANDSPARGFFNEFLMSTFDKHRKVLELVGSKTRIAPATEQLSGLGFSSTQKNTLICRVKGSFTRTVKVIF